MATQGSNDGREEIEEKAEAAKGHAEWSDEIVERVVEHGWNKFSAFFVLMEVLLFGRRDLF